MGKTNFSSDTHYFRKKLDSVNGYALTFDDIICLPGFSNFDPKDANIETNIGPFSFKTPIFSAAMDTVTETEMAIQMALSIAAAVFLDLALILVFSALTRTKEQQLMDGVQ